MTIDHYQLVRRCTLGVVGIVCFTYALGVYVTRTPDPFSVWIPTITGLLAAAVLFGLAWTMPREKADALMDELSRATFARAYAWGYWVAVAMFYLIWFLTSNGITSLRESVVIAAMIVAGTPLLIFVWLDWKAG